MNIERRKESRVPLQLPVEYHGSGGETYHCSNCDMSPNGMSIRSKEPFEVGSPCRLGFALPDHPEKTEITGEVRWHTLQPAGGRVGIKFSESIDFSVPFPVADKAIQTLRQRMDSFFGRLYQTLADACVWVNPRGEMIQYDERFLGLTGCSERDVEGQLLSDFAHLEDRERLASLLVGREMSGISSSATGLFRMQAKDRRALFWKIRVLPKPPESTSKEIWIEDMTESRLVGTYAGKHGERQRHLPHILGASATGFLLRDVLNEASDPLTAILGRLDLLRYKLALQSSRLPAENAREFSCCVEETEKAEKLVQNLSKKFRYALENTFSVEPGETRHFDINQSLSTAIAIVNSYDGTGGDTIRFESRLQLPTVKSNEQEFTMIFVIFLLLSRDCLKDVSDRTIRCETTTDNNHIVARILHNGCIRKDRCLDIIFHSNPVASYFFETDSICFMDTLLHYGNLLMKKNNVRTKINNIPGQFSLSLLIPALSRSDLTEKPQESADWNRHEP